MTTAALYLRISDDQAGDAAGVERQRSELTDLCARSGWTVGDTYADNSVSAYDKKARPEYDRLLADGADGRYDTILAWASDRLSRDVAVGEELIGFAVEHHINLCSLQGGNLDVHNAGGRLTARIQFAMASYESDLKRERLRSKHRQIAERGEWGGGRRPFGYQRAKTADGANTLEVDAAEAAEIVDAARRVLAGESLWSIKQDWDGRVPTSTGAAWSTTAIKGILTAPRVTGLRAHLGDTHEALWDPIIDRDTWEALRHRLSQRPALKTPRSYLLTCGVAVCAECGEPLHSAPRNEKAGHARAYACLRIKGGCGKVATLAGPLEDHVTARLFAAIEDGNLPEDVDAGDELRAERATVDTKLEALADQWAAGDLDDISWASARRTLRARHDTLVDRLATIETQTARRASIDLSAGLEDRWDTLDHTARRLHIVDIIEHVDVRALRPGEARNRFLPGRATITWRR